MDYQKFCEECCESEFESYPYGCVSYIYDCPRVKYLQRRLLIKIAEKRGLEKFPKLTNVYTNSRKTIALGAYDSEPARLFKGSVEDVDDMYTGAEYGFASVAKKFAYSRDYLTEVLDALKQLGEEDLDHQVCIDSEILAIKGRYAWGAVLPVDLELAYSSEKNNFLQMVREGWALFKKDIRDEVRLVDLSTKTDIDWDSMNADEFEELCVDVLSSFESIQDCLQIGGSGDEGRDIKAKEKLSTIAGLELRDWCVQCKHFVSRQVNRTNIDDLNTLHTRFKFDVFCIMTSSRLSPGVTRLLEEYEKQAVFSIKIMDRQFLERRIKEVPKLSEKFLIPK
jgi:hypothetical protein